MLNEKFKIPPHVKIIAVSKLQPIEKINQLIESGHLVFGENYVKEAIEKIDRIKNNKIEWHFIGSLQKNKVKQVVGAFDYIHSVDSIALAEKIQQIAGEKNIIQKILIQVNIANELSKTGVHISDLEELITEIKKLNHIRIVGLMTMPPLTENPESVRSYFRELRLLGEKFFSYPIEYSMGTSHDYEIAVGEGATMIRLGTILFGERPRKG